jgi:hypothetical protein
VHNFGPSVLGLSESERWVTAVCEGIRDAVLRWPGVALETTPVEQADESDMPHGTLKSADKSERHTI